MTTIEATQLKQAHCRGCAEPTFMFDPDVVYPPHMLYCDNCYGTAVKYGHSTDDCSCYENDDGDWYNGDDDYLEDGCPHGDPETRGYGNTTASNPVLSPYDFSRLLSARGVVEADVIPRTESVTPDNDPHPEADTQPDSILAHRCRCGSTRFRLTYDDTCTVSCYVMDLNDHVGDVEADDTFYVDEDVEEHERDGNETNHRFQCSECARDYTGEWDR